MKWSVNTPLVNREERKWRAARSREVVSGLHVVAISHLRLFSPGFLVSSRVISLNSQTCVWKYCPAFLRGWGLRSQIDRFKHSPTGDSVCLSFLLLWVHLRAWCLWSFIHIVVGKHLVLWMSTPHGLLESPLNSLPCALHCWNWITGSGLRLKNDLLTLLQSFP